jgi:hypothetical protein
VPEPAIEPPFICDVTGCDRPVTVAYIGGAGDFYLCALHAPPEGTNTQPRMTDVNPDA